MVDFTYDELNSNLGTNTADGLRNIANTARNFACTLYQNSPASVIGTDPTGVGAFSNAFWSRLCAPVDRLPPAPAVPPFSGGQCNELYNVTASVQFFSGSTPGPVDTRTFTNLLGPITGWRFVFTPDSTGGSTQVIFTTATQQRSFGIQGTAGGVPQVSVDAIVPVDGTDACGNPFPTYPYDPPALVDVENNIDVNFGADVTVNVPVSFQPIIIPVGVQFSPQVDINVGPVRVSFDAGGVTFSPTFAPNVDINLSPRTDPRPNPPTPIPPTSDGDCPDVDLQPVLDRLTDIDEQLDEIQECACGPETELRTVAFGPSGSGTVNIPDGEIKEVSLSAIPGPRVRSQFGGGGAPNVEFIGWYSFGVNGTPGDRLPISYAQNRFVAPPGYSTFSYTLTGQSTATGVVTYEVELTT